MQGGARSVIRDGKRNVLGILIDVIDYEAAVDSIVQAAREKKPFAVTALAVHGLMTGVLDAEQRYRLDSFNLVVPDGQPIRWALKWLFGVALKNRVYGPNLTLAVCERAEKAELPVYFYGSTPEILSALRQNLLKQFPRLRIVGARPSMFRTISPVEKEQVVDEICRSGAAIIFVGLGCPRQEVWAYEFREYLPGPILAVGAAFPFLAGTIPQAPRWMQDHGLEWLFRLSAEPLRLWRRYLLLNPLFLCLLLLQGLGITRFQQFGKPPTEDLRFG
jgi:N-acetylglucosaminyldiphosphoundecaprenol N-acetyl-beta-D-mannosaminyltransferase